MQLLALLFVRPGELRHAEWTEIDFDNAVWSIPPGKMKMRRPHFVPLSSQAIALFRDLQGMTGRGRYCFPSGRTVLRPMSENCLNGALRRLGFTKAETCAHGFRVSASSLINEAGLFSADAIERQLAHADEDTTRGIYNRAPLWSERVKMMTWWAERLDALRRGAEVLALPKRA